MRWVTLLVVLTAAGFGLWGLLGTSAPPDGAGEYIFDVESGDVIPRPSAMSSGSIVVPVAVGIAGDVARPYAKLGDPDRWMYRELVLPSKQQVTGKELLEAMGKLAPIRFRSQRELDRFESLDFEVNLNEQDLILGSTFEGWATHHGFQVQTRDHFIMVYDPESNDAFAKELRTRRERAASAKAD